MKLIVFLDHIHATKNIERGRAKIQTGCSLQPSRHCLTRSVAKTISERSRNAMAARIDLKVVPCRTELNQNLPDDQRRAASAQPVRCGHLYPAERFLGCQLQARDRLPQQARFAASCSICIQNARHLRERFRAIHVDCRRNQPAG